MTNDELNAIVEAAKARQDEITPAPWECENLRSVTARDGKTEIHIDAIMRAPFDFVAIAVSPDGCAFIAVEPANLSLITAAPDLNAAVIALAVRVEALEAENKRLVDVITENARDVPWRYAKDRGEADEIAGRYARAKHDNYMKYTNDEE